MNEIEVKFVLYFTESFASIYTITPGEPSIMPIVKRKHQVSAIISLADNPFNASRSARQGQILKSRKGTGRQPPTETTPLALSPL